ncbi:DNA primase [Blastococcus sp. Marseille-P5729]|uniref:DNA primase n=1 Tax=Blastococcus sp. Marseille-P5729 TaxID=2086582 RepID=UPI0018FEDBC8|nr:DNA primase [Blastococcus sp. Marseille-P5729]
MAGLIRNEDIQEVRERAGIADVIGEYVTLRNAGGGNLKGLCPFHDEKTPSFSVSPGRGFFYCFGCGESGDVISFVQKIDHVGFAEAVEQLADRVGIQLRYESSGGPAGGQRQPGMRQRLVAANRAAVDFYREQLSAPGAAATARAFLAERGFGQQAAADFSCGFAPDGWDLLVRHLRQKGFSEKELLMADLARRSSRGTLIDRFRKRLMWPIFDRHGDPIGFGARRLFDDDPSEAKYLNTSETPLYKKSTVLFGIEKARREIAKSRQVVVVEGYTDVMACHLAGVPTAVASCGTSFGSEHISVIRQLLMDSDVFRGEVIFVFDGDEAGQKAALKAFADDQKFTAQTFVAVEQDGRDPCELRQDVGDAAVRDLIARRQPLVEFAITSRLRLHDLDTVEGRVAALDETIPLVAQIKDVALRTEYARRLAGLIGVDDPNRVVARVRAWRPDHQHPRQRRVAREPEAPAERAGMARPRPDDPAARAERESLKLALQAPAIVGPSLDAATEELYRVPAYAALRRHIEAAGGVAAAPNGQAWVGQIAETVRGEDAAVLVSLLHELAVEPLRVPGEAPDHRYVTSVIAALQLPRVSEQIRQIKSRLQRINPLEDDATYRRTFGELATMEQLARGLREQAAGGP